VINVTLTLTTHDQILRVIPNVTLFLLGPLVINVAQSVLLFVSSKFVRANACRKLLGITSHEGLGLHISNPFSIVTYKDPSHSSLIMILPVQSMQIHCRQSYDVIIHVTRMILSKQLTQVAGIETKKSSIYSTRTVVCRECSLPFRYFCNNAHIYIYLYI
jgi:hypothetical protein